MITLDNLALVSSTKVRKNLVVWMYEEKRESSDSLFSSVPAFLYPHGFEKKEKIIR